MPRNTDFPDYEPVRRRTRSSGLVEDTWSPGRARLNHDSGDWDKVDSHFFADQKGSESEKSEKQQARVRILKRGHFLSYIGLFLFTIVLYFRPYELFSGLQFLESAAYVIAIITILLFIPTQFGLEGNVTARIRCTNLILLLAVTGLLSIPGATRPSEAWDEFNDVFIKAVLMFIVMVNVVRSQRRLRQMIYVALAVTFLLSVNAISDYQNQEFAVEGYRIKGLLGGMFGNPNDLALHFVTMTPLAIALMMGSSNVIKKIIFGVIAVLVIAANVVTYSRGGFIGLLTVAGILAWKFGRAHRLRVSIILPVCAVIFIALAPGSYGIRVLSIFIPGLDPVGSSTARQEILNRSVIVSLRHPLAGIGMGNFHIYSLHETVTHNAFTQVSAEMGLTALIIYLMFLTAPIKKLGQVERETFAVRKKSQYYHLAVGIQAAIIGYMVTAFFAAVAYQWYAFYLVAYGVCLQRIYESNEHVLRPVPVPKNVSGSKLTFDSQQSPVT
jgi:putative inorganic carbon (hco3(-)) transporter